MNKSAVGSRCFKCFRWQLIDFHGTKLGWSVFAVRLMFLVKRVNGFGNHRSIFSFIQTACASRMPKRVPPRWMPLVHAIQGFVREDSLSSSFFHPTRVEHFQSKCFTMESSPNHLTYVHTLCTWKGSIRAIVFLQTRSCVYSRVEKPSERERERDCLYLHS